METAPSPDVSVVVAAYQAEATIDRCVRALVSGMPADGTCEIIVVDDGSSDATAVRAADAGAEVVRLARNVGPAAARNAGLERARGNLVVFTDADCEATPEFVANLTHPLDDPRIGGTKGIYLTHQRALVARFVQYEYEQRYRHTARQAWLDFVETSACCFRRVDILRVGAFDPRLRVCEDQDLSFRLAREGVRIVFAPGARTYHQHSEHVLGYMRKKFHIARWKVQVLRRHPDKAVHDSHTPQLLKVQVILACAILTTLAGYARWRWRPVALTLAAYLAMTAPFVLRAARRDPLLGAAAPGLLFARDLALGAGLVTGAIDMLLAARCAY